MALVALIAFPHSLLAQEPITPSHVFQQSQIIVQKIEQIRTVAKVNEPARTPGVQMNKKPLHVYSKALEVMEKISRYQSKLGIDTVTTGQIPMRKVTPAEVFEQTQLILGELSKILEAQKSPDSSIDVPFVAGKGPSDVYEVMWQASYLLDSLAGQTSPNEVFRNTQYIMEELSIIAKNLNVELKGTVRDTAPKTPKDVNLEAFKALHKVGRLERYLDMPPVNSAPFPAGNILPTDVLDTTNTILAELARIKVELGIKTPRKNRSAPSGKTPTAVYQQVHLITTRLDTLLDASKNRKPANWADVASN